MEARSRICEWYALPLVSGAEKSKLASERDPVQTGRNRNELPGRLAKQLFSVHTDPIGFAVLKRIQACPAASCLPSSHDRRRRIKQL